MLAGGVAAQASFSAVLFGVAAVAPAIRRQYGLTLTQAGVVIAAVSFGLVATLLLWGIVSDRVGERAVLATGLVLCAGGLVATAFARSYGELVGGLTAAGAFGAATQSATGRAVMGWFGPEERGLALGIRQTAVPVGGAVAAVALPALTEHLGLRAAFVALAGGCLGAAIVSAALIRSGGGDDHHGLERPLRDPRIWLLCVGSTFYVVTQISVLGFLVLFLHDSRGVSNGAAAVALAVTQILGGVMRIAAGRWSDRFQARVRPLRQLGILLAAATVTAALLVHAALWLVVPALVVAGTLSLAWNGLSYTAAAEAAGRARSGAAIGLQQTFLAAGSIVGPIAFAAVVRHSSWRVAFLAAATSPLLGYVLLTPLSEEAAGVDPSVQTGRAQTRQP